MNTIKTFKFIPICTTLCELFAQNRGKTAFIGQCVEFGHASESNTLFLMTPLGVFQADDPNQYWWRADTIVHLLHFVDVEIGVR